MTEAPRRIEDFGTGHAMTVLERRNDHIRKCKALPRDQQAAYWRAVLREDPEVAALSSFRVSRPRGRKR